MLKVWSDAIGWRLRMSTMTRFNACDWSDPTFSQLWLVEPGWFPFLKRAGASCSSQKIMELMRGNPRHKIFGYFSQNLWIMDDKAWLRREKFDVAQCRKYVLIMFQGVIVLCTKWLNIQDKFELNTVAFPLLKMCC